MVNKMGKGIIRKQTPGVPETGSVIDLDTGDFTNEPDDDITRLVNSASGIKPKREKSDQMKKVTGRIDELEQRIMTLSQVNAELNIKISEIKSVSGLSPDEVMLLRPILKGSFKQNRSKNSNILQNVKYFLDKYKIDIGENADGK